MPQSRDRQRLATAQTGQLLSAYLGEEAGPQRRAGRPRGAKPRAAAVLDGGERLRIVDTLIAALEGAYCHLPQKRAAYATDPVHALELLRTRAAGLSDSEFHLELTTIVTGLRDAHTLYTGPRAWQGAVATLPFLVEQYGPHDDPTFIVSKVSAPKLIGDAKFVEGVELVRWNGIEFKRAVDLYAEWETGGRPDARRARALETFTSRALEYGPPPDERWVVIEYRPEKGGDPREVRIPWRVVEPGSAHVGHGPDSRAARRLAVNHVAENVRRAKKLLFSGGLWEAERAHRSVARAHGWIETRMQDVLAARPVATAARGSLGYLRIWSFDVEDDEAFVREMARLLGRLPQSGLILDLRGNPGGDIWAAERSLQLLTPHPIVPTRFSLVATPMTRAMAASPFNRLEFEAWLPSLEVAIATGEPYSQPLPLTDPAWCNDIGQCYSGPVVCVVDPNTYSSGDLFAAGFVDNQIGTLVCVGEATGAGGANVWTHHDIREALADTSFALAPLPEGVGYTLAVRRAVRSGAADGVTIEDLGIRGIPYAMTRTDLLASNADLIEFCAGQLAGNELTEMRVTRKKDGFVVTTVGLDELEAYVDGRPIEAARGIQDGDHRFRKPRGTMVEFVGRRRGHVSQRRRLPLG